MFVTILVFIEHYCWDKFEPLAVRFAGFEDVILKVTFFEVTFLEEFDILIKLIKKIIWKQSFQIGWQRCVALGNWKL